MNTRRARIAVLLCLSAGLGWGQFETSELMGAVHDSSGAAVPKATITLTNEQTGVKAQTVSDASGLYDFLNVKVGEYTIGAELAGFEKFTTTNVAVNVNSRQRVNVTLKSGELTQSVEVKGAAATLETDTNEHGQVINTREIVELPLNGRNDADLALLSTNVHAFP